MSDQPPSAPRRRPRRLPQQPSKESRFIGYVVLGFGTLAVIAMLMIAFGGNEDAPQTPEQQNLQKELAAAQTAPVDLAEKKETALQFKRQKKIDQGDMQGGWQAAIGDYLAVMQIQKGAFQIIMALPDPNMPRKYFSGTFTTLDDLIILKPQPQWGEPKKPANSPIVYDALTSSTFPMIVGFDGGKMVWQNVPPGVEERVYVPARSPLLSLGDMDYIIWKKTD